MPLPAGTSINLCEGGEKFDCAQYLSLVRSLYYLATFLLDMGDMIHQIDQNSILILNSELQLAYETVLKCYSSSNVTSFLHPPPLAMAILSTGDQRQIAGSLSFPIFRFLALKLISPITASSYCL